MNPSKKPICARCGQPIESLDDLVLRGLNYCVHPLHEACWDRAKSQVIYRLSLNMRGSGFWVFLAAVNALLLMCLFLFPTSWTDLRWFFPLFNVPQLIFRALAFFEYEVPLRS
ncbi:MAG: hypothetical protein V2B18_07535 [Pseudomonadota bacterium]